MEQLTKPIIGLTGLIGSGKSTVASIFSELGARVIDTDSIAHQLTLANGLALPALVARFGAESLDSEGALNRKFIRELVFANPKLRLALEEIIHPLIFNQVKNELKLTTSAAYTLLAVPLLFRSKNYLELTWRNIFVDCPLETLISRIKLRSGLSAAETTAILAQQVAPQQQRQLADDIIYNHSILLDLQAQIAQLHANYLLLR